MLILVPSPISDEEGISLDSLSFKRLSHAFHEMREKSLFLVEDLKPGRARWIKLGLPREALDILISYNEHTSKDLNAFLIKEMKEGKTVYLMSDAGLPGFCDPGRELISFCHEESIKVSSMSFSNSALLALVLSGFENDRFLFEGFLPLKEGRIERLKFLSTYPDTIILMDTPYRFKRLLEEIHSVMQNRKVFVGLDLNSNREELILGTAEDLLEKIVEFKREFILILNKL